MREYALYALVAALAVYAWRDWFKALCGLILLMAILEHHDMPKNIMGVQGLNPWNVLMASVLLAWLVRRRRDGLTWDMPRGVNLLLLLYLGVIIVGFVRMMFDHERISHMSVTFTVSDYLINVIKWVLPGVLLFDGCRSTRRLSMAAASILGLYFLLALQVIYWVRPGYLFEAGMAVRSSEILGRKLGYTRCSMSMMLSGASWALIATLPVLKRHWQRVLAVGGALIIGLGLSVTGGRMGYLAWLVIGVVLCALRWRRYLPLIPLFVVILLVALPGVSGRFFHGVGETSVAGTRVDDDYQMTSGRTLIWPYVVDKIWEAPVVGHGRLAMRRTGLANHLRTQLGESFGHPHNAYLQLLLDNGILGFVLVMPFYFVTLAHSIRLFCDKTNPWYGVVGGVTLSLVLALMVCGFGSQHFYPRETNMGMWTAVFLMFRVSVERSRMRSRTLAQALTHQPRMGQARSLAEMPYH